jgi:hypothetical protein
MAGFRIYEIASRYTLVKNQYFGDINDYLKYGILRQLARSGRTKILVCWMLTPDDKSWDGGKTGYLSQPQAWRRYDTKLFDSLQSAVHKECIRSVAWVAERGLIHSASFIPDFLEDNLAQREDYFDTVFRLAKDFDLLFFDPDTGLEVKTVKRGRAGSSGYLYREEVVQAFALGCSVLIYQQFPHEEREKYISERVAMLRKWTGAPAAISFSTSHVVFFLLCQEAYTDDFTKLSAEIAHLWQAPNRTIMEVKPWQT